MEPKTFIKTVTAAQEIDCAPKTIREKIKRGEIKAFVDGSGEYAIERRDWEEYKARNFKRVKAG